MLPDARFVNRSGAFWGSVRFVSERLGYSTRSKKASQLRDYSLAEVGGALAQFAVSKELLDGVCEYLNHRASFLNETIQPLLMDRSKAEKAYRALVRGYKPQCHLPQNKQKGKKRHLNYLTCIVNVLTEKNAKVEVDDDPRGMCIVTDQSNAVVGVLSRWMDGAYPGTVNPKAVWEIKEYYGTTTFGSRVADGVYESLLDGLEIRLIEKDCGKRIHHYLFVDDYYTWWGCGKSYLCRLVDMMHMELVDEVIFGREVFERWPAIIKTWR